MNSEDPKRCEVLLLSNNELSKAVKENEKDTVPNMPVIPLSIK